MVTSLLSQIGDCEAHSHFKYYPWCTTVHLANRFCKYYDAFVNLYGSLLMQVVYFYSIVRMKLHDILEFSSSSIRLTSKLN